MHFNGLYKHKTMLTEQKKINIHSRIRATYISEHENDGKFVETSNEVVAKKLGN